MNEGKLTLTLFMIFSRLGLQGFANYFIKLQLRWHSFCEFHLKVTCQEIAQKYPAPNNDSKLPELLKTSIFLCNSDKYSMFYSIGQMPANYLDMMQETFQMEKEQLNEMKNDQNMLDKYSEEKIFARMYIQDLFRFYNIYIYNNDFSNPVLSIKEFPTK